MNLIKKLKKDKQALELAKVYDESVEEINKLIKDYGDFDDIPFDIDTDANEKLTQFGDSKDAIYAYVKKTYNRNLTEDDFFVLCRLP